MTFHERKEFLFDNALYSRKDSAVALRIYEEYTRKHSPVPNPTFFEVERSEGSIDPLWHCPTSPRTQFTSRSPISVPAINQFQKPDWKLTKLGIVPQRRDTFWLSHLVLQQIDYFPMRGDQVFWVGYRYMIINVTIPPESYWQQTGVWLGLTAECIIVPEGDARPVLDVSVPAPAEVSPTPSTARPVDIVAWRKIKPLPEK